MAGAAEITRCHDGDTCTALDAGSIYTVRLHCIDAPEIGQRPWGGIARAALLRMTARGAVEVRPVERDRYGRTVAELLQGGRNINLWLVREGYAAVYPRYCQDPRYYDAEAEARRERRGIWAYDGPQQTPWQWRR